MKATVVILSSLLILLCAGSFVQAEDDSAPYEGVVSGSNVYVRSGPSMGSYPVTQLSAPDRVAVVETLSNGWLAIQPVRGCYGVVSAQYCKPDATGKIGTITGDSVFIRAAGTLRKKNFDNPLGKRNRGDRVRILGRVLKDGKVEWYVIKPPSDLRFYILGKYVQAADGATPPAPADDSDQAEQAPAVLTPVTPPSQSAAVGAPVRQELDALREIRALEKELVAETAKPVETRDFKDILTRAENIKLPANSRFQPIYASLMQYLREEVTLAEKARATDRMVDEILRKAAEKRAVAAKPVVTDTAAETPAADRPFHLQGVLAVSALYTIADPSQPKRYVVRHPKTKGVLGYAQSTRGKVDLGEYEGKNVGLRGRLTYDDSIALKILEVDTVTPLDGPAVPAKTAPVEPEPVEEPKPAEVKPAAPVEPAPAEQPSPAPVEPEPVAEPEPEPEAVEPKPLEPTEPAEEPKPAEVKPAEPVEPEPVTPAKEPELVEKPKPAEVQPAEPVEPEPVTPVKEPEPVEEPKPAEVKPAEPIEPEPVTPVKEPEPVEEPKPAEVQPAEPIEPEPVTPVKEPEPVEEPKPEPIGPKPVVKKPAEVVKPIAKPEEKPAPETKKPIEPGEVKAVDIQPMEIEPLDVEPAEVEALPVPGKEPVKTAPAKTKPAEPKPMPAGTTPEPEMNMFEVEATEGDIEVEWD